MNVSSQDSSPFAATRWSIVTHAVARAGLAPRDAFAELCLRYAFPVYAYVRRSGHAPAAAHDITRAFLGDLMNLFREPVEPLAGRRFRRFLLERLDAFLRGERRDPSESAFDPWLPVADVEVRYAQECAATPSAEQAFQRAFALEVLARALRRLAAEAEETDHVDMYRALSPFLARDPGAGECDALAATLGMRTLTITVALKRLRQRFRELAGEELADTVAAAEELAGEQDALHAIMREDGPAS